MGPGAQLGCRANEFFFCDYEDLKIREDGDLDWTLTFQKHDVRGERKCVRVVQHRSGCRGREGGPPSVFFGLNNGVASCAVCIIRHYAYVTQGTTDLSKCSGPVYLSLRPNRDGQIAATGPGVTNTDLKDAVKRFNAQCPEDDKIPGLIQARGIRRRSTWPIPRQSNRCLFDHGRCFARVRY